MARETLGPAPTVAAHVVNKGHLGTAATADTGTGAGQVPAPPGAATITGQVVTNTAFGASWNLGEYFTSSNLAATQWFTGQGPSSATIVPQARMVFIPVDIYEPLTINTLAVEVTVAGTAGSVTRLGIYGAGGPNPGAPILDAGTVATATVGFKTIAVSVALNRGRYWFVAVNQGAPTTSPTTRCNVGSIVPCSISGTPATLESLLPFQASVTGALPASLTLAANGTTVGTRVGFKRA